MGQRHQIYLRIPAVDYGKGNGNNRTAMTIGIHHQWLWGVTAAGRLEKFLKFVKNQKKHSKFCPFESSPGEAMDILAGIYSVDAEAGYFHQVHRFVDKASHYNPEKIARPDEADNNNGATLIDLTGDKPKYCFISWHHLECLDKDVEAKEDADEGSAVKNFVPMSVKKWISLHYSKTDLPKYQGYDNPETVLKGIAGYKVMTTEDCIAMFPKLRKEFNKAKPKPVKKKAK